MSSFVSVGDGRRESGQVQLTCHVLMLFARKVCSCVVSAIYNQFESILYASLGGGYIISTC